jgi:cytochrome c peroxidase
VADEMGMKAPTLFTTMYMHAAPQDAVLASMRRTGAIGRFWHPRTRAMQDRARTPVNKPCRRGG